MDRVCLVVAIFPLVPLFSLLLTSTIMATGQLSKSTCIILGSLLGVFGHDGGGHFHNVWVTIRGRKKKLKKDIRKIHNII